ncbi:hypothetical protein NX059_000220 [Plenodomus lindquistii]|nr:hypothetical protein NX059_000220 [Plenodomus lindquistii]
MPQDSASPAPRPRTSEDKLYRACLNACITGIEQLPVNKRHVVALTTHNNTNYPSSLPTNLSAIPTQPAYAEHIAVSAALPLPLLPVRSVISEQELDSTPHSPQQPPAAMNSSKYAALHGAPPQGPRSMQPGGSQATPTHLRGAVPAQAQAPQAFANAPPLWGSQDARSNLAVQPAADAGTLKLKKKAVKIVGVAAPLPTTSQPTPAPTPAPSPAPGPVMGTPKETESYASATRPTSTPSGKATPIKTETPTRSKPMDDSLEDMFTRLTTPTVKSTSQISAATSPTRPDKNAFSFEGRLSQADVGKKVLDEAVAASPAQAVQPKREDLTKALAPRLSVETSQQKQSSDTETKKSVGDQNDPSQAKVEAEYMRRACEYVNALPGGKGTSAHTIQFVANKLRSSYVPTLQTSPEHNEALKARYVFAVLNYIKGLKRGVTEVTAASVKQILDENDGDFLLLCVTLVEKKQISLDNLDEVIGLCKKILEILPKPEPDVVFPASESKKRPTILTPQTNPELRSMSQDPVDNMSAWPSQEKRDNRKSTMLFITHQY